MTPAAETADSAVSAVELVGRRRRVVRTIVTAAILVAVQLPMRQAVGDGDPLHRGSEYACVVPARLSLLVDAFFILAYTLAAIRALEYLRARGIPQRYRWVVQAGVILVGSAAVLDVAENAVLWFRFDAPAGFGAACPALTVGGLSVLLAVVWAVGVAVLLAGATAGGRTVRTIPGTLHGWMRQAVSIGDGDAERAEKASPASPADLPGETHDRGGTIICCSGGGIRSASFCLGALQELSARGIYKDATSVVGVSGGGYMAAAFHIVRRQGIGLPFAPGSPELDRLRRHTRYLLPQGVERFRGVMSLLYGVSVNLVLIGVSLRALSWVLGWALADTGVLTASETGEMRVDLGASSWYALVAVGPLVAAVGSFALEKLLSRWLRLPTPVRQPLRKAADYLLIAGLMVALLLVGVPYALLGLNRLAPTDDGERPAIPSALQDLVDPTTVGPAAFAGLAATLAALGAWVWKNGLGNGDEQEKSAWMKRASRWVLNHVGPWVGSAVIVIAAAVVLLRWTAGYATSVAWRSDWSDMWWLLGLAAAVFVLADANRTSLHHYYRERLSYAYLVSSHDGQVEAIPYDRALRFSEYGTAESGPQLVMAAAANGADPELVPAQRGCASFVFEPGHTGLVGGGSLPEGGRKSTAKLEAGADLLFREVTVPAVMAVSGAAVSPLAGRFGVRTRAWRLLLATLNARLGIWLPNPYWSAEHDAVRRTGRSRLWDLLVNGAEKPGPYRLFREAVGRPSLYERMIYVTDGGHYDNLGLVEALRRRPKRIIVIDASNDSEDSFTTLGQAIATARMDLGIEVELDPSPMVRADKKRAEVAWVNGRALDEDGRELTEIFYLKALMAGKRSWDIEQYAAAHPEFPRRGTADQLYGEWDFEAHRALGAELAQAMVAGHRLRTAKRS